MGLDVAGSTFQSERAESAGSDRRTPGGLSDHVHDKAAWSAVRRSAMRCSRF